MGSEVIDRLIFALDGDLSALKARYAQAEADAGTTGTRIAANFNKPLQAAAQQASVHASAISKALGGANQSAEKFGRTMEIGRREVFMLGAEMATGNFSRSPFTIARIATEMLGLHGSAILAGLAVAAIPIALVTAAVQMENALDRVNQKLIATGHAAGVTTNDILGIAQSLDRTSNLSERGAFDIAGILAGRGNVGSRNISGGARAAGLFNERTGLGEDKAASEFEKILAEPAKGAAALNSEFKLLDTATTRLIQDLEASGDKAGAQRLIIDSVNARFGKLEESSWSLSRAFDQVGKFFSDFWFHTAQKLTGTGETDEDRLARLKKGPSLTTVPAGMMAMFESNAASKGEIAALEQKITRDTLMKRGGEIAAGNNAAVSGGMDIADKYDKQAAVARVLNDELGMLNRSIAGAVGWNAKYREELIKERDAVAAALANQRTPSQIAASFASDEIRIAQAPENQRDALRKRLQAQRQYEANLANPESGPYAAGIRNAQLSTISPLQAAQTKDRINDLKRTADGLNAVAAAFDTSTAAGARARTVDEAHQAFLKGVIFDEKAYAEALQQRAFATERARTAERIGYERQSNAGLGLVAGAGSNQAAINAARREAEALAGTQTERDNAATGEQIKLADMHLDRLREELRLRDALTERARVSEQIASESRSNVGLGLIAGAGGNEAAVIAARREAEALSATQGERDNAASGEEIMLADMHLDQLREELRLRDQLGQKISTQAIDEGLGESILLAQKEHDLRFADAELRAKEIADLQAILELKREGWSVDDEGYQQELQRRQQLNESMASLTTETADQTMWASFREGLSSTLAAGAHGFDSLASAADNFAAQLVEMALQLYVIKPLLNSMGGTGTNPPFAFGGGGGGGGGLDSLFNSMDLAAGGAGMGGGGGGLIADLMSSFAGFFDEGGTIGPGQWGIKSGMPEIIQGGTDGVSVQPLTAPVISAATGNSSRGESGSYGQNPGRGGGSTRGGDTHNYYFPGVADRQTAIVARSQFHAHVTRANAMGQRNA